jgi:hypothetical protein
MIIFFLVTIPILKYLMLSVIDVLNMPLAPFTRPLDVT